MGPTDFKRWRKSLHLSQKEAADKLGLKRRVVQYYEKGERNGEKVKIPKTVRLACFAISQNVFDYDGIGAEDEATATPAPKKDGKPQKRKRAKPKKKVSESETAAADLDGTPNDISVSPDVIETQHSAEENGPGKRPEPKPDCEELSPETAGEPARNEAAQKTPAKPANRRAKNAKGKPSSSTRKAAASRKSKQTAAA